MRLNLQFSLMVTLSLFVFNHAISQSKIKQEPLTTVIYNANVDSALTADELGMIKAVYGDTADETILRHPQRVKDIKNILRNRVQIVNAGKKKLSGLPKLSQVELLNDFVPTLSRNANFYPENFNPLMYKFDFYSRNSEIYWVDNTTYYIEIKSQYQ